MKNIVIVGGNAGGGLVASRLERMLREEDVNITVIDKNGTVDFMPSYTYVALGARTKNQVSKDFNKIASKKIKPIKAEVTDVNAAERKVKTNIGEFSYDILVLSPGAAINESATPGLSNAEHFWTLDRALRMKQNLGKMKKGKIVISLASMIYRCPPVPWEMSMLLHEYFLNKGLRNDIEITVAHPVSKPFEMFGPNISNPLTQWLSEMNINYQPKFTVAKVDEDKKELISTNNETIKYDMAIVSPVHEPPEFVRKNDDLKSEVGWGSSRLRDFKNEKYDDIYAIGDLVAPTLGLGMAGVFAHFQADTAASFIVDDITGSNLPLPYNSVAICAMEGGSYGWFAYCDFKNKLNDPKIPFPDCTLTGRGRIYKIMHAVYERYYFATIFRGRI